MAGFNPKGTYFKSIEQAAWQEGYQAFEGYFAEPDLNQPARPAQPPTIEQLLAKYPEEIHQALMHGYGTALWIRYGRAVK